MSDNANEIITSDCRDAELRDAMLAAFGAEALDWLDESDDALSLDSGGPLIPSDPIPDHAVEPAAVGLDQVLVELSRNLEDGETAANRSRRKEHERQPDHGDAALRHVVFEASGQRFAVPLRGVQEIDRCGKVTPLPRTPDWLRGVTNLRGRILSVTDFRRLLGLPDEAAGANEKIIVIQSRRLDMHTALVVDRVVGIRVLEASHDCSSLLTGSLAAYGCGVWAGEDETIVLIDPDQILDCSKARTSTDS